MEDFEIRDGIELIKNAIETAKENMDEILQPYFEIYEHLECIEEIQDAYDIDTKIDFESAKENAIRSCIENDSDFSEIGDGFKNLIADLESW